ncbi:hypothetical protein Sm713_60900 [Streptomyces sp. TS71-3]|nr:hypothetical protein Sm713_60900 [Streptomyces sp. TS71-3]
MPDPGRDPTATFSELAADLDLWADALGDKAPKKHVWHCPVRTAPGDRILSDEEWGTVARRVLNATGIAPNGDDEACRWIAVRHAPDHIHIVATLVRADRTRPRHHKDGTRAQAECRKIEKEFGLRRLNEGDGTAAKRPTSAERHKAERQGKQRTVREKLRETVRQALAGTATETEFFDRLKAAGLLVRTRVLPSGDLRGYTVAMPGDRNKNGKPVFYSGSTLAPDLSLPRIRNRFDAPGVVTAPDSADGPQDHSPQRLAPSRARRGATHAAWKALLVINRGDDGAAAAQIAATGEVLDALAKTSALHTRQQLREAAWAFERASRSHAREEFRHSQQLRRAARDLIHSGPASGRGEDGATTAMLIDTLFFLALATAHWHAQHHHAQQAAAAQQPPHHRSPSRYSANRAGPPWPPPSRTPTRPATTHRHCYTKPSPSAN